MRVPLSWLKTFVDIDMSVDDLAAKLTGAGMEVASIDYLGLEGSELPWDAEKVLVCNILEVRQHPNADKLVLAEVDYGAATPHTVVTGAPNLYEYKDQGPLSHPLKSVFAREGAELYDGHAEGKVKVKLKGRPVRGVMSDAMLCSEKELGMSDEHEGILFLPEDAPVGTPLRDYLGDAVLDIDLTPNFARALSILGVAREVAALTGAELRMPDMPLDETGPDVSEHAAVTVEAEELCPRFTVTRIDGITIKSSPLWMQRRLTLAGMRPISNVVDISNYVMLELGQPTHAYDADKVANQQFVVRMARPGETLTTLDNKERTLTPDRLLVCDSEQALGLAGVMGGLFSEVSDGTSNVLIEAAIWETTTVRRAAQAFKLPSEASRRFERGVDWELPPLAQRRLLSLLQQYAGGSVYRGIVDAYPQPWQPLVLDLTPREVKRIVGIDLNENQVMELLQPLGFECTIVGVGGTEGAVRVTVPSFRQDVTIMADLCEEVARLYGYERIPETLLNDKLPAQANNTSVDLEEYVRDVLAGCGLDEAITNTLTSMPSVARLDPAEADPALHLRLANPMTPEREYLRRSVLPVLLEALSQNLRETDRVGLFEISRVFLPKQGQELPDEPRRLAVVMAGPRDPLAWYAPDRPVMDFFDLKGVVETLFERMNLAGRVRYVPVADDPRFHPGRTAAVELIVEQPKGKRGQPQQPAAPATRLGVFGELHPDVRNRLALNVPRALAAELDLEQIITLWQPTVYRAISRYPAVIEDLAPIVPLDVPTEQVGQAIRKYAGNALESLVLFDVYTGPQVGAGNRSLAYRLTFRTMDKTLTDADISKIRAKIMRGLEYDVKATFRS